MTNEEQREFDKTVKCLVDLRDLAWVERNAAIESERKIRFCLEQDAKRLAWWQDTFQSFSRAEVLKMVTDAKEARRHREARA